MAYEHQQRAALRLLDGIEMGSMTAWDSFQLIEEADPALVYLVFGWLRAKYAGHPASEGVIGRIVAICQEHPKTTRIIARGEQDAIVTWFEESYPYRDLDRDEFIAIVVDKLES